ncbi:TetR/AcrR family transcriptional regulator [Nocardia sp. BMG51109]|uniref:TetR/AcrR family transcriptional regulator n=1 Tax=Nocardia sp. BMG51109 TaxID=1056816 RepID=UPI0004654D18|nr:TetR/AcrR family transcriptional regulator [Nocardia sp. BMG51109]
MPTTGERGTRGPYARSAQRRAEIAAAVFDIVVDKGHDKVTTAEVAERSATSEATVLYHFPTRDHLLVAALAHAADTAAAPLPALIEVAENLPENLHAFLGDWAPPANIPRLYAVLAAQATTPGHPAREYFAYHYARAVDTYAELVRHRQAAGAAHPGLDPADVARQFLATWDGLQAQWLIDPSVPLADLVVAAFRRLTGQNWMRVRDHLLDPNTGI